MAVYDEKFASESPTMSTPSEDKSERVAKEGRSPKPRINLRLKMSPSDQELINIMNQKRESSEEPEDSDEGSEENDEEREDTQSKFKEEFDSDVDIVKHDSNLNNEKKSIAVKSKTEVDSYPTENASNIDGAGEASSIRAISKDDTSEKGHFIKTEPKYEGSPEEQANSIQIASDYEVSEEHIEWVDGHQQLYAVSCTKVWPLSPYCQVMVNPSWETSDLYRVQGQRGPWLLLVLKETSYKVHRELVLSKVPRLPSIYFDLNDDESEKHKLDESLHNVNLMLYWVYHGTVPPRVEIKRGNKGVGMTWDAYEIMKFAWKLRAEEFMACIHKVVAKR